MSVTSPARTGFVSRATWTILPRDGAVAGIGDRRRKIGRGEPAAEACLLVAFISVRQNRFTQTVASRALRVSKQTIFRTLALAEQILPLVASDITGLLPDGHLPRSLHRVPSAPT